MRGVCGQLPGRRLRPGGGAGPGGGRRPAGGAAPAPPHREGDVLSRLCGGGAVQPGGPHPGPGERQAVLRPVPPHPAHVPGGGLRGGQAGGRAARRRPHPAKAVAALSGAAVHGGNPALLLRLRRPGPGSRRPVRRPVRPAPVRGAAGGGL